jgi:hypothetical protein
MRYTEGIQSFFHLLTDASCSSSPNTEHVRNVFTTPWVLQSFLSCRKERCLLGGSKLARAVFKLLCSLVRRFTNTSAQSLHSSCVRAVLTGLTACFLWTPSLTIVGLQFTTSDLRGALDCRARVYNTGFSSKNEHIQVHLSHLPTPYSMSRKPSHSSSSRQLSTDSSSDDGRSVYTDVSSSNSKAYDTGAYRAVGVTAGHKQPSYGRSTQRAVAVERPGDSGAVHRSGPRPCTKQSAASNAGHFFAPPIATTSRDSSRAAERRDRSASRTRASNADRFYAAPAATTSGGALTAAEHRGTNAVRAPASNTGRFYATAPAAISVGIPTSMAEPRDTNAVRIPASNAGHLYATPTYTTSEGTPTTAERRGSNVVRTTAPDIGRFYTARTATSSGGASTLAASERSKGANANRTPASNAVHAPASDAVRFYTAPTATTSRVTPAVAAADRDANTVRTPTSDISRFYAVPTTTTPRAKGTSTERSGRDTSRGRFYAAATATATGATLTADERRDSKAAPTHASNGGRFYAASTAATYRGAPTATERRDTSDLDVEPRRNYQSGQVSMHHLLGSTPACVSYQRSATAASC